MSDCRILKREVKWYQTKRSATDYGTDTIIEELELSILS